VTVSRGEKKGDTAAELGEKKGGRGVSLEIEIAHWEEKEKKDGW